MLGAAHPMDTHRADSDAIYHFGRTPDSREGVMAFLEQRARPDHQAQPRTCQPNYPYWDDPGV